MKNNHLATESEAIASVNYSDGFTFDFNDDGRLINVFGSAWTGKETVSFNGKIVAEKRSYTRKSILDFTVEGDRYEVEFNMVDMLRGELHCTLIKNGVHFKTLKKALKNKYQITSKSWWKMLLLFFVGGFSGYISVHLIFKFFGE